MNQVTTQKTTRKLQLSRETLRELDPVEARSVVGGVGPTHACARVHPTMWTCGAQCMGDGLAYKTKADSIAMADSLAVR